jgi:ADP-heptose:LPS heptosyltransferase
MQWSPSQLIADLTQPVVHAEGWRPKPQVVELLNIAEHSHKVSPDSAAKHITDAVSCPSLQMQQQFAALHTQLLA